MRVVAARSLCILLLLLVAARASAQPDAGPQLRERLTNAAPKTTVRIAPGEYWVAVDDRGVALEIPAGVTVDARGVTLRLIPNDRPSYSMVLFMGTNSHLVGGTLIGDRRRHRGISGEWGMCISVRGATQVSIRDVRASDCWGDGIYVGAQEGRPSRDVTIDRVELHSNRRNNVSLVAVDGFRILNTRVHGASGTPPQAGIVLEPNAGTAVVNGSLKNVEAIGNTGRGVVIGGSKGVVKNIELESIRAADNTGAGFWLQTFEHGRASRLVAEGNRARGLVLLRARDFALTGYTGNRNLGVDVSVDRSERIDLDSLVVDGQPASLGGRAINVQRSSAVTAR